MASAVGGLSCAGLELTETRAWHPLSPSWVPLPSPGQVKQTGDMRAVFCAWSRGLPAVRLVPRRAARADRTRYVGTSFSPTSLLAVTSCVSGGCSWSTGLDFWRDDAFGRISHCIFMLVLHALLGSTVDTWCIFSWLLEEVHTYSTLGWICFLRFTRSFSPFSLNGEGCTVTASG